MNELKIAVIGVGGGGSNMIQFFQNISENKNIDIFIANTDVQALNVSKIKNKIQLGKTLTKGLGAGMKPEIGEKAAMEEYDEVKNIFAGYDLVFLVAGLGGGTGTGAAPVIAKAIKENNNVLISIVTQPFKFEGKKRERYALNGINKLKEVVDSLVVIINDKILENLENEKIGQKEAFCLVDKMLFKTLNGIINTMLYYHENDINVDFNDLKTVVSNKGYGLIGTGKATGEDAASIAMQSAIDSPFLEKINIERSSGILINFVVNEKYPLVEIEKAMNYLYDMIHEECNVIFGTTTNNNLKENEAEVILVISGQISNKKENKNKDIVLGKVLQNIDMDLDITLNTELELDIPTYLRKAKRIG